MVKEKDGTGLLIFPFKIKYDIIHMHHIVNNICFPFLVVYSNTKLTKGEITRMSCMVGLDWDSLAGLMNIPYSEREEIRVDCGNYLSISSKAKKVFELFNDSTFFDRHILIKYFKELGRHDLEKKMLPVEDQVFHDGEFSFPHDPSVIYILERFLPILNVLRYKK